METENDEWQGDALLASPTSSYSRIGRRRKPKIKYLDFASATNGRTDSERLVIVIDVSPSMQNNDWPPSRLHAAIKAAGTLLNVKSAKHPNDEVGIVVFSEHAKIVHSPVKVSGAMSSLNKALRTLKTSRLTNIAAGLNEAGKCLGLTHLKTSGAISFWGRFSRFMGVNMGEVSSATASDRYRRIILLTDGAHNCMGRPESVAERLKRAGVIIDCIGIGGSHGEVDEKCLKAVASKNTDGTPRYCFIGEQHTLIKKFEQLGNRIAIA